MMNTMIRKTAVSSPTSKKHRLQTWLAELHDVKWQWVVFPGSVVFFINIIVVGTIISIYASFLSVELQSPEATADAVAEGAELVGIYGSPVVQFFATIWVAFLVCRRQGTAVSWYGLLIGVVSGLAAEYTGRVTHFSLITFHYFHSSFGAINDQLGCRNAGTNPSI